MIQVGIERLEEYLHLFDGKRVGLITNPTGVNRQFETTIDLLQKHTNLVALFSPEHGVRGDLQAGVSLGDYIDPDTGCMVYSLYGKHKQPTPEMMAEIDVLVFDIQDVGARFYTFLYTMAYALQACALSNTQCIVFDRPNPVGGTIVEGNIILESCTSFVGNHGLPQRYGLTVGELAQYFNEERGIHAPLEVVPMTGYKRSMSYHDTGLPWVMPSPNIPTMDTPLYYLSTCIFEGTNVSEGRGTTKPFQIIAAPYLDTAWLIEAVKEYDLPGVQFRPFYVSPTFSKHQGVLCAALELYITDETAFQPVYTGMVLCKLIEQHHPEFTYNKPYKEGLRQMIDLLNGDDFLRTGRLDIADIQHKLQQDRLIFTERKRRYHIYED